MANAELSAKPFPRCAGPRKPPTVRIEQVNPLFRAKQWVVIPVAIGYRRIVL
jgi:hypothetical protein